jgi:maltose operon protein
MEGYMNTFVKTLLTSSFLLSLTACSTVSDIFLKPAPNFLSREEGFKQIKEAQTCCNGDIFNTKKFINVVKDSDENYNFDLESAEAFEFTTGKSFFRVFQLPLNTKNLTITLDALLSTTGFLPEVDFYNTDKIKVASIKSHAFKYRENMIGNGKLEAKFHINNAAAPKGKEFAYMVVYTSDKAIEQTTGVTHPEVKRAIALNTTIPDFDKIQVKHSPIGVVNVIFTFKHQGQDTNDVVDDFFEYLSGPLIGGNDADNRTENVVLANGVSYSTSAQTIDSPAVKSHDSEGNEVPNKASNDYTNNYSSNFGKMLKETEDMYNKLITEAVEKNDIEKAMQLLNEAKMLGSTTAQETFIKAVKSNN